MGNKWVFLIKQNPDDSIARYKAHLVAKCFHQQSGIDFHETFSLVINLITIRTVLSIAFNRKWGIRQLYVNNAFLNGHLTEKVYMVQPQGCETSIICIMFVIYTRQFMSSNKLRDLGTKHSAPSYLGSAFSDLVQTRLSLFTPAIMCTSISWFMLTI